MVFHVVFSIFQYLSVIHKARTPISVPGLPALHKEPDTPWLQQVILICL